MKYKTTIKKRCFNCTKIKRGKYIYIYCKNKKHKQKQK